MTFINAQFPMANYGSSGGPSYKTTVSESVGGGESRNGHWSLAKREFDAAFQVKTQADLDTVIKWFHACRGRLHTFRFKDWSDFKSCSPNATPDKADQQIGIGNGSNVTFQLTKAYTVGSITQTLNITKPVSGTVLIAVNGTLKTETTHYTIDYSTGIVTFLTAPGNTLAVTAGYEYDLECRFNTDSLSASIDDYNIYSSSIPIIEVR
ncbi:MAG: DUF2460 domain-containing protein [Nitrosomonas sp.]|nr:DUF2460 domain-containing protein [Nitrosomonas sp.]